MRVLIHGAPPYAQSGYGTQCKFMCRALLSLGHEVAVSCYAGVHEERTWTVPEGCIQLLSTGGKPFGNGLISLNYRRWNADLMITLLDPFSMKPDQFKGLTIFPWIPVDCDPLGVMEQQFLDIVAASNEMHPIAMSEHARKMMADKGYESAVIPFVTDYYPDKAAGIRWRRDNGVPAETFLIAKVGVNNEDDRKTFAVTEQAFAKFIKRKHKRTTGLYMHTEPQAKGGSKGPAPNLVYMGQLLGLKNHVKFCDEEMRSADLYGDEYMMGVYNAADVLDSTGKGEGFGVPIIEALACGTPVIGSRNSAVTEKIRPEYGWLIGGQRDWACHHHAWWQIPSVTELDQAYQKAYSAAGMMRQAAAKAGAGWSLENATRAWKQLLA